MSAGNFFFSWSSVQQMSQAGWGGAVPPSGLVSTRTLSPHTWSLASVPPLLHASPPRLLWNWIKKSSSSSPSFYLSFSPNHLLFPVPNQWTLSCEPSPAFLCGGFCPHCWVRTSFLGDTWESPLQVVTWVWDHSVALDFYFSMVPFLLSTINLILLLTFNYFPSAY